MAFSTTNVTIHGGQREALLYDWPWLKDYPLLDSGVAKAQWAEQHLAALQRRIGEAFAPPDGHSALRAELDPDTGYHIFRVDSVPDVSGLTEHFQHSVSDVAMSFRAALDKLAWRIACIASPTGVPKNPTGVHFPIRDNAQDFAKREDRARRQIPRDAWAFFESFQPYYGVDGRPDGWHGPYAHPLSLLRDLANDDKHRDTQPTFLIPNQFDLSRVLVVGDPKPIGVGQPLVADAEVLRARLVATAEPRIRDAGSFAPLVTLNEGRPAVQTLQRIAEFVRHIFTEFSRQFPLHQG